jgi:hypothetical protein
MTTPPGREMVEPCKAFAEVLQSHPRKVVYGFALAALAFKMATGW